MALSLCLLLFSLLERVIFSDCIGFSAESFAEISFLAEKGKTHLESLKEKTNVPHFGPCWKNAILDLQIGCKFLSENVQSDLALRFTDCFLQMSDHEPLNCDFPRSACLKKLSDRAFNAYTEFYTHTQSICYFLQSQVWREETEKTINKLSLSSHEVSKKLEEAGKVQEKLLDRQKESLVLQYNISNNSRNIASALHLSQDKINEFMRDFNNAATEQKELLVDVFENLVLFRSWAVSELSWFNSTVYFAAATLLSFLFTSVSRTREARMIIFIIFAMNYFFERLLTSSSVNNAFFGNNVTVTSDLLNSWIWLCRKFCICLAVFVLLYIALTYCDYNFRNYKLLLEIRKQNIKILSHFVNLVENQNNMNKNNLSEMNETFNNNVKAKWNNQNIIYPVQESSPVHLLYKNLHLDHATIDNLNYFSKDLVDSEECKPLDNEEARSAYTVSISAKKIITSKKSKCNYNLRSNRRKTLNL